MVLGRVSVAHRFEALRAVGFHQPAVVGFEGGGVHFRGYAVERGVYLHGILAVGIGAGFVHLRARGTGLVLGVIHHHVHRHVGGGLFVVAHVLVVAVVPIAGIIGEVTLDGGRGQAFQRQHGLLLLAGGEQQGGA